MIWGLGLPSALHVKYTVFPEVTSTSCGSDVIRGTSIHMPNRSGVVRRDRIGVRKINRTGQNNVTSCGLVCYRRNWIIEG